MTGANEGPAAPAPEAAVLALTREIPNYADRLASKLGCPVSELWALTLAASGRMTYAEPAPSGPKLRVRLGVPDALTGDGSLVTRRPGTARATTALRYCTP